MTISSQNTVHCYVGDGQQTHWPILFLFFSPEHIKAIRTTTTGIENALQYGTDYQVELLEGGGGRCTASVGKGEKLTLYLDVPITQDTDLRNTGLLRAEVIERMSDKLTLVAQQHQDVLERCVKVTRSSPIKPDEMLSALTVAAEKAEETRADVIELRDEAAGIKKATQNVYASSQTLKGEMDALLITMNAQGQAKVDAAQQKVIDAENAGKKQVNLAKAQVNLAKEQVAAAQQKVVDAGDAGSAQVNLAKAQVNLAKEQVAAAQRKVVDAGNAGSAQVNLAKVEVGLAREQVEAAKAQVSSAIGQVNLAKAQVNLAKVEVGKAEDCVDEARDVVLSASSIILSGMVFPFNGSVNSNGFPVNRMTNKEDRSYALCDGRTYTAPDGARIRTPDLRNRFIVGSGATYSLGDTGGASTVTLTNNEMPSHDHSVAMNGFGGTIRPSYDLQYASQKSGKAWNFLYATGGSQGHENRPPYYALAYIMKL